MVNKSTVPVGCGNLVETLVREGIGDARPGAAIRFGVASNPEFLREGSAVGDSLYPDRIVVGGDAADPGGDARTVRAAGGAGSSTPPPGVPRPSAMISVPLVTTSLTSAEMIKYAANAFLAMKIGFANEIANICERVGAEAPEVMAGIGLDSRIGAKFLNPGMGWGGSCFGKDIQSLLHTAREYGYKSKLLQASLEVNTAQRQMVIQKLQEKLYILRAGPRAAGTGVQAGYRRPARRAQPAHRRAAAADGRAREGVRSDRERGLPEQRPELKIRYCDSAMELASDADALVLVTEWNQFHDLDLAELGAGDELAILMDGRNFFIRRRHCGGLRLLGIGRCTARLGRQKAEATVS